MNKDIDIFSIRNVILLNNQIIFTKNGEHYYNFPYNNYKELEKVVRTLNPRKIGTNEDLDETFEKGAITFPISLAFDYCVLKYKRVPTYEEVVDMYIELSLEKNSDSTYTEKKCFGANFTVTREAVAVRIFKGYFSFIREYMTFLYLRDKLSKYGATVFMNREDDYKGRIDIGVIYNNVLYIIDTSVKTKRSDEFEQRKIDGTRRNLTDTEKLLIEKYNCVDFCRILAKANMRYGGNTYNCGQLKMYKSVFLDSICTYILNNNKYGVSINADDLLTAY